MKEPQNLGKLRFFLDNSNNNYARYLAASTIKEIFVDHWLKIEVSEKLQIKDYLINFLIQKGPTCEKQVLKMIIILVAKVTKLSWFDHPELQAIVNDLIKMCEIS